MTLKYPLHAKRECLVCGGAYYELPDAMKAHQAVLGHWPRSLTPAPNRPAALCASCGGPIDPHGSECRCST